VKKLAFLGSILAAVVLLIVTATPAMAARAPLPPAPKAKILTHWDLSWDEAYTMWWGDGSFVGGPWAYPVSAVDFDKLVNTYYSTDIGSFMAGGYAPGTTPTGFLKINGAGKLFGYASYISGRSGLPIFQVFRGDVTVTLCADSATGTVNGTYSDQAFVFGNATTVLAWYPGAVPVCPMGHINAGLDGWWYAWYGNYTMSPISCPGPID
jgi:hypothetical protein